MFCLADICKILDLQTNKVKNRLNERGVTSIPTPTYNQHGTLVEQEMTYVNEQNLYKVIMRSDKPQAEPFQDWVCGEVLPSIRKTGGYIATTPEMTDEEIMARAVLIGQATIQRQKEQIARLEAKNEEQRVKIEADAPKVVFADAVLVSKDNILIRQLVKFMQQNGVKIGEQQLFDWMHKNGYLCRVGKNPHVPTKRAMDLGVLCQKEHPIVTGTMTFTSITPYVTPKGQLYFLNKFLNKEPMLFDSDVIMSLQTPT